jgi:hypothetical protein
MHGILVVDGMKQESGVRFSESKLASLIYKFIGLGNLYVAIFHVFDILIDRFKLGCSD